MDKKAILYSFDSLWKGYLNHHDSNELKSKIRCLFGTSVVSSENLIDFNNLRNFVYSSRNLYDQYNDLIKPYVEDLFFVELSQVRKYVSDGSCVFFELPLLFEYNLQNNFDFIICVACSKEEQKERVFDRNPNIKYTEEQFSLLTSQQMPMHRKMLMSDMVIWNDRVAMDDYYYIGKTVWDKIHSR